VRRRHWFFAFAVPLAGCGIGFAPVLPESQPINPAVIGPVFPDPGGGPELECRNVPREMCASAGLIEGPVGGVVVEDVSRVVVTCLTDSCDTKTGGEFRVDVVLKSGGTQEIARGVFGGTDIQPPNADP
jgi:hypothetical protein